MKEEEEVEGGLFRGGHSEAIEPQPSLRQEAAGKQKIRSRRLNMAAP